MAASLRVWQWETFTTSLQSFQNQVLAFLMIRVWTKDPKEPQKIRVWTKDPKEPQKILSGESRQKRGTA